MKLYLDKDVLGCWKRSHTMDGERKETGSMENGCEDILESLRFFYCFHLLFIANDLVKSFEMCAWQYCTVGLCPNALFLLCQPTR